MISRTRRLERLEEMKRPNEIVKFWQIVTVDSAGRVEHGPGYEFPRLPEGGFRPTMRGHKTRGR